MAAEKPTWRIFKSAQRVSEFKTRPESSGTPSSGSSHWVLLELCGSVRTGPLQAQKTSVRTFPNRIQNRQEDYIKMPFIEHVSYAELERLALDRFVPALLTHGFCYVDGFLGDLAGTAVLDQVTEMHRAGALQDGRLAGSVPGVSRRSIRGDKTAWVGGSERGCEAVSFLLNLIDRLVSVCASRLGTKTIRERSKVGERYLTWKKQTPELSDINSFKGNKNNRKSFKLETNKTVSAQMK